MAIRPPVLFDLVNTANRLMPVTIQAYSEAEKKLVKSLLETDAFGEETLYRLLTDYVLCRDDRERANIILDIMKEFWVKIYKTPQASEIFNILMEFEDILYALGKRGHFIHQFNCFLLGCYILKAIMGLKAKKKSISEAFGSQDESEYLFTWLLTSSAHDCGYPLQVVDELAKHLSGIYDSLEIKETGNIYKNIYTLLSKSELQEKELRYVRVKDMQDESLVKDLIFYISKLTSPERSLSDTEKLKIFEVLWSEKEHGLTGALILARRLILQTIHDSKMETAMSYALPAIAVHGFKDKQFSSFGNLRFSLNPYAYLLFLVDNLQDWNRPVRTRFDEKPPIFVINGLACNKSHGETTLSLRYLIHSEGWKPNKISQVAKWIGEKRRLFKFLSPWNNGHKLTVATYYETDSGKSFDPILIPVCR
ncbi:hypothetical protein KA005_11810 [bacterium]|nr:hypothetical protein [bacterium]